VTFKVEAHDGLDKIGEGLHVRAPVELARFMKRVEANDRTAIRRHSRSELRCGCLREAGRAC